jgi:hypothetical protein
MKTICIVFLLVLIPCFSYSQKVSQIYDKKGRLVADTSFSISKTQLKFFTKIEDTLIKQILHNPVEYSEIARDANVQDTLVISFIINTNGIISDIRLENKKYRHFEDSGACSHYFLPKVTATLEKVKLSTNKIPTNVINKKYFLVFIFHLENNKEDKTYFRKGIFIVNGKRPKPETNIDVTRQLDDTNSKH